jgi:MoxR-like ATPase
VLAQDILDIAFDVIRHRLVLSYEAMSDNVTSDMLLARIFEQISAPAQPLQEHVFANVNA